mmetsp:Transcript_22872/g.77932  ORF Transcript_22872/g.77932 Transcript_22872/m.77932 type:complete len:144 (+) Transcript_22872:50-481(+)
MALSVEAHVLVALTIIGMLCASFAEILHYSSTIPRAMLLFGPLGYRCYYYARKYCAGELDVYLLVENLIVAIISEAITAHAVELCSKAGLAEGLCLLMLAVVVTGLMKNFINSVFEELLHNNNNGPVANFSEWRVAIASHLML